MKKSYAFNVLSKKECITTGCNRKLKKRIAEEHPEFTRCFHCHVISEGLRGHHMKG